MDRGGTASPPWDSDTNPEGGGDLVGTLQTVADDQAEGLSTFGGAVELADPGTVNHVPGDDVGGLEDLVAGHWFACELREL